MAAGSGFMPASFIYCFGKVLIGKLSVYKKTEIFCIIESGKTTLELEGNYETRRFSSSGRI